MNIVFYADKVAFHSSREMLAYILYKKLNIPDFKIEKNENGKPFLILPNNSPHFPLFFSVTHTSEKYFLCISKQNVGIDTELLNREVDYSPIIAKFSERERELIKTTQDFLSLWTIKESVIKWLGGSIARDLKKVSFENKRLKYSGFELPVKITQTIFESHILSLCHETEICWKYEQINI